MKSRASLFKPPKSPFAIPGAFGGTAFKPFSEDHLWSQRVLNLNLTPVIIGYVTLEMKLSL